jgi:hypothetical protein
MARAFQNRRQQVLGEVRQLKRDVDSYNDNRTPDWPIRMIWDFTGDLEELEQPASGARAQFLTNERRQPSSQSPSASPGSV